MRRASLSSELQLAIDGYAGERFSVKVALENAKIIEKIVLNRG
jgi:hypothetical protein